MLIRSANLPRVEEEKKRAEEAKTKIAEDLKEAMTRAAEELTEARMRAAEEMSLLNLKQV